MNASKSWVTPIIWGVGLALTLASPHLERIRRYFLTKPNLNKNEFVKVLEELSESLLELFYTAAKFYTDIKAQSRQDAINSKGREMTFEQLLPDIHAQSNMSLSSVLNRHNLCMKEFEDYLKHFKKDEDVKMYCDGINEMYRNAINGIFPRLPGKTISKDFTKTAVIKFIKNETIKKVEAIQKLQEELLANPGMQEGQLFNEIQCRLAEAKCESDKMDNLENRKIDYLNATSIYSNDIEFVCEKYLVEKQFADCMKELLGCPPGVDNLEPLRSNG